MNIWLRFALASTLLLAACGAGGGESPDTADDPMDRYVLEQMEAAGVPGVAYAIVSPTGIEHSGVFGHDGHGDPITESTPFLWGSVAKAATATLLVELAEAGEIDLDAPVVSYLPDFGLNDPEGSDRVTVRNLLDLTGGIPPAFDLTDGEDPDRRANDVLDPLRERDLLNKPGEEHVYSSTSYLVATALVEEVSGRPFPELLREHLLEPAGMENAIVTPGQAEALAPGHRYVFGRAVAFSAPYDPVGAGYGYLGGDLHDAVALARTQLSESPVLSAEQRAEMQTGGIETGAGRTYNLGWRQWEIDGTDARKVWVSGTSPGWFASIVVLPDLDRAIVVLQNAYGTFQEPELLTTAWGLASLMHDVEPVEASVGPMYAGLLTVLSGLVIALAALAIRWAWRIARPGRIAVTRRRLVVNLVAGLIPLAVLAAGYLAIPRVNELALGQVSLWAPDLAWLLYAGLVLIGLLAALRVALTMRLLGARIDPPTGAPVLPSVCRESES